MDMLVACLSSSEQNEPSCFLCSDGQKHKYTECPIWLDTNFQKALSLRFVQQLHHDTQAVRCEIDCVKAPLTATIQHVLLDIPPDTPNTVLDFPPGQE